VNLPENQPADRVKNLAMAADAVIDG